MDTNLDFSKIAWRAVKANVTTSHAPDLTDYILDNFVSGDGFESSFIVAADTVGLDVATAIFDNFLTDEALAEYTEAWKAL
jgi:hypothetical protein